MAELMDGDPEGSLMCVASSQLAEPVILPPIPRAGGVFGWKDDGAKLSKIIQQVSFAIPLGG